MSEWTCYLCNQAPPTVQRRGVSLICRECRARLRACGLAWCGKCRAERPQALMAGQTHRYCCKLCYNKHSREYRRQPAPHARELERGAEYRQRRKIATWRGFR